MKLFASCAVPGLAMTAALTLLAQPPTGSDTNTLDVLRQTLAEQQRHPDKIIRTPTNLPAALPASTESEMPALKQGTASVAQLPTKSSAAAALEKQYLEGKLTGRQYQKALADLERKDSSGSPAKSPKLVKSPKAGSGPSPALEPAIPTPPPQPTEKQRKVSDVESRLDVMIKEKEARDRAAQTNTPAAPGPKATKRERLDFLLKQVVAGKLSDEEYKKEREKILAEPE